MLIKILLAIAIFSVSAIAEERQSTETQINDVVRITFEHGSILVVTPEKAYQVQDWANSFAKGITPNREICPTCAPTISIHFVQSQDGKMGVTAKTEMWGEVKVTITLTPCQKMSDAL